MRHRASSTPGEPCSSMKSGRSSSREARVFRRETGSSTHAGSSTYRGREGLGQGLGHGDRVPLGGGRQGVLRFGRGDPVFNILRVKRDIGEESTLGLAYTDRVAGSHFNRVASLDSRIVFGGVYAVQAQGAMTFDRTDGPTVDGHLWDLNVRRSGRRFGMDLLFKGLDSDLVERSGFLSPLCQRT